MKPLFELIPMYEVKKVRNNERADIIQQIYSMYDTGQERLLIKKANWKRYVEWLKENKIKNSPDAQLKFKKSKRFIKPMTIGTMCYFLSHLKKNDLYYVFSVVKDKKNRNESIGSYVVVLHNSKI
jgi:hypothetical protein